MPVRWDVKTDHIDPEFKADIDARLGDSPYSWAVTRGFASMDAQRELYEKYLRGGPLAAPPGHSAHNYGLAVDVARLDEHGRYKWDTAHPAWPWLWAACKAHPRLRSGHEFPPAAPADDDHIQAVKWAKIRASLRANGTW